MKLRVLYIIVQLAVILFPGCEKNVGDVKLPLFEQKLVINSFISPSDTISMFFISSNRKIYGEIGKTDEIGKISGTISDGINEVALDSSRSGLKLSMDKMQIGYGKRYTIKVNSETGLEATATCNVPQKKVFMVKIDTFSVAAPDIPNRYFPRQTNFILTLKDIPGEQNFYRLGVIYRGYFISQASGQPKETSRSISIEKEFLTDAARDGLDLTVKSISGIDYFFDHDSAFLEVYLYNLEKSYYLYHRSLNSYIGDENPFSEPSPVYSNVTGGLGIFTSYTVDTLVFRLK